VTTHAQIQQLANEGRLIDVRTAAEFRAVRIPGAVNIPLADLEAQLPRLAALKGPLAITCHSGKRAAQAQHLLGTFQKRDVVLVSGGTEGWRAAGGAVEVGKASISLERQVRIAAGGIAAVGGALALGIDSLFAVIPLAIGTGLVVAGITDTCLLGMLLARLPWNRRGAPDPEQALTHLEARCSSSA
jgi:rhodanese-related sulfurtransferase